MKFSVPAEILGRVEVFHENRDSINIVLGAVLGAYVGLAISKENLSADDYWLLASFLAGTAWFVSFLNSAADRFHRKQFGLALWYVVGTITGLVPALFGASHLPVDINIVFVTFGVWIFLLFCEIVTASFSIAYERKLSK